MYAACLVALPAQSLASGDIYGTYGGYPVAHVTVNGALLTPDVPAIIVNGRTMVSLAYAAKAIGGAATWDQATMTASISTEPTDAALYGSLSPDVADVVKNANDAWPIEEGWLIGGSPTTAQEQQAQTDAQALLADVVDLSRLTVNPSSNVQVQARMQAMELASTAYQQNTDIAAAAQDFLAGNQSGYQSGIVAANDCDLWLEVLDPGVQQELRALAANQ